MQAVDKLADWFRTSWQRQRNLQSMVALASLERLQLILVKSKYPMNVNGKSIRKAAMYYQILPSNIYLLHDELDRKVGVAKIKEGGSARGHNGVRSAISCLQSDVMPRLLLGIDRPADHSQVIDYVLHAYKPEEVPIIEEAIEEGLQKVLRHMHSSGRTDMDLIEYIDRLRAAATKSNDAKNPESYDLPDR